MYIQTTLAQSLTVAIRLYNVAGVGGRRRRVVIYPGDAVRADAGMLTGRSVPSVSSGSQLVGKGIPGIDVFQETWAAVAPVLDVIERAWFDQLGFVEAFLRGARVADEINDAIEHGESLVQLALQRLHVNSDGQQMKGTCLGCGSEGSLTQHEVSLLPICDDCSTRSNKKQHDIQAAMRTSLAHVIAIKEFDVPPELQQAYRHADKTIREVPGLTLSPTEIKAEDYYIPGITRTMPSALRSRTLSLDGKYTITIDAENSRVGYHAPGNVVATSAWLNLGKLALFRWPRRIRLTYNEGKHTFPPGWLHLAKEIVTTINAIETSSNPEEKATLDTKLKAIMQQEHDLYLITKKIPHSQRARRKLDVKQAESLLHELRTGKAINKETHDRAYKMTDALPLTGHFLPPFRGWKPNDIKLIESMLKEIYELFGDAIKKDRLAFGNDGCPFPGPPDAMPIDWDWWSAWLFFGERLLRMWVWCNGKWVLVETTRTLYRESLPFHHNFDVN